MKSSALVIVFSILTSSVHADDKPAYEKKAVVNEHKVLTGLKLSGAVVGTGLALYMAQDVVRDAYQEYKRNIGLGGQITSKDVVKFSLILPVVGMCLYPAYTLGQKALRLAGIMKTDTQVSDREEVVKEHKVVSGLKATGAAAAACLGLVSVLVSLPELSSSTNFSEVTVLDVTAIGCGAYVAYDLGYKAFPRYINRIRGK